jgi:TatD DNase family protein
MLIDAHAHIHEYADNLAEAINQINQHSILTLAVSLDVPSYLRTIEIAHSCPQLIPAFGIHPWRAEQYKENLCELDKYLEQTPLIGEAGLDFHWIEDKELYRSQIAVFEYECSWSQRLSKPMNLHTKGAEREVLNTLQQFNIGKSIIHWYSGPLSLIESYLAIGCYFTVGVEVLTSAAIQKIAEIIPADRVLLETDNPGGYEWLTKEIGMPVVLLEVLAKVSEIKRMETVELRSKLSRNWTDFTRYDR